MLVRTLEVVSVRNSGMIRDLMDFNGFSRRLELFFPRLSVERVHIMVLNFLISWKRYGSIELYFGSAEIKNSN